jgi:hypothetical protein
MAGTTAADHFARAVVVGAIATVAIIVVALARFRRREI